MESKLFNNTAHSSIKEIDNSFNTIGYSREDPDSYDAYREPEEGDPHQNVVVNDEFYTFTWDRGKSNECITDVGDGKDGFSFYLARHVFDDPDFLFDDRLPTNKIYDGVIGIIPGDKKELVVINLQKENDNIIRIISATYASERNQDSINNYRKNKKYKRRKNESALPEETLNRLQVFFNERYGVKH
jgi:uncharacterized DUF497 family protein